MKDYEHFIDQNKIYLEARFKEASNKSFRVFGFPIHSVKEAFQAVISKKDMYYLPYCLYVIQFGLGVSEDKKFAMTAFKQLLPNSTSYLELPILAYICAYCHNRDGDLELSENILNFLTVKGFSPALTTHGDLAWMQKDSEQARRYYLHGANLGHYVAKTRHIRLFDSGAQFILRFRIFIGVVMNIISDKNRGEKYLYLDFYGFKK